MEPVQRTGEPADRVADEVASANVSQLVQQHRTTAILRPTVALGWQDNCWSEETAGERHLRVFTADEPRCLVQTKAVSDFPERIRPLDRVECARTPDDSRD